MRRMAKPKSGNEMKILKRLMADIWKYYGFQLILVAICIFVTAFSNTLISLFLAPLTDNVINPVINGKAFSDVKLRKMGKITSKLLIVF